MLGVNGVVGAGIFLLPGRIAHLAGGLSWAVYLGCASLCFLIGLCYAEMGSRYQGTGGAYLYARDAYGPFLGFLVGWIVWLSAVLGWTSLSVGFADALGRLVSPVFHEPWGRAVAVTGLVGGLSIVNLRGARVGAMANNLFSVLKLLPLALFVGLGAFHVEGSPFALEPHWRGFDDLHGVLLWGLFLYSGFEEVGVPAGETRDPQHTVPRAVLIVLGSATLVYMLVQLIAQAAFPGLGDADKAPLADAAQFFLGSAGLTLVGAGTLVSLLGTNTSIAFTGPRSLFALAADGYVSPRLAAIDGHRHAPSAAIIVTGLLVVMLPLVDMLGFEQVTLEHLVRLSALATLLQYISTCAAVLLMRARKEETAPAFRAPGGAALPLVALALAVLLVALAPRRDQLMTLMGVALGLPVWWMSRGATSRPEAPPRT